MPKETLQNEIAALRRQLDQQPTLDEQQRAQLETLIQNIESKLANGDNLSDDNISDNIALAVENFEINYPTLAVTLRSIIQTLANIGI